MIHVIDLKFRKQKEAIASFLMDTGDGLALIETGPHSRFHTLKAGIEDAGYKVEDVKHVFITHIHLDHAGACWAFAELGATIYLHPFGFRHMANPEKLMSSAKRIYQDMMDELWGEMRPIPENQLRTVAHEEVITVGNLSFKSWHTPGHAVHHIAWQLDDVLFAGDVAGVRINQGIVMAPCPPPDINIEDWMASIELVRNLNCKKLYITHYGEIEDIENHLSELERLLHDWANLIKPHYLAGKKPQEVIPEFQAYVRKQILDHGMSEEEVGQYEAANPAWMSVAGLMRYWHKKLNA